MKDYYQHLQYSVLTFFISESVEYCCLGLNLYLCYRISMLPDLHNTVTSIRIILLFTKFFFLIKEKFNLFNWSQQGDMT